MRAVKSTFGGDNSGRLIDARASRGAGQQSALASLCWRPVCDACQPPSSDRPKLQPGRLSCPSADNMTAREQAVMLGLRRMGTGVGLAVAERRDAA